MRSRCSTCAAQHEPLHARDPRRLEPPPARRRVRERRRGRGVRARVRRRVRGAGLRRAVLRHGRARARAAGARDAAPATAWSSPPTRSSRPPRRSASSGAEPVLVDCDPRTRTTRRRAGARASSRAGAAGVIAVHLYGHPADVATLAAVAAPHRRVDAGGRVPGAPRARRRRRAPAGSAGSPASPSIPSKNLGATGEGGAVTTDDPRARRRRPRAAPPRPARGPTGMSASGTTRAWAS